MQWTRGTCEISTDRTRLDRAAIHGFLTGAYWSLGIPRAVVDRSIDQSMCFGLFEANRQIGFARVISDGATFAYVADVFILESHRGRGLARWLMETILAHPDLQGLRRWALMTRDAHELYRRVGFRQPEDPSQYMEILNRDVYA